MDPIRNIDIAIYTMRQIPNEGELAQFFNAYRKSLIELMSEISNDSAGVSLVWDRICESYFGSYLHEEALTLISKTYLNLSDTNIVTVRPKVKLPKKILDLLNKERNCIHSTIMAIISKYQ